MKDLKVRVTEEIHTALKEMAKADSRSMSAMVNKLIKAEINKNK